MTFQSRLAPLYLSLVALLLAPETARAVRFGEIVPPEDFRPVGQVVVLREGFSKGIGTGTLIAPDLVITAAHVIEAAQSPHHIKFGLDGNSNQASVIAVRVSPRYRPGTGNSPTPADDVALLRLDRKFPEDLGYYSLVDDKPVQAGQRVTAVGFGLDSSAKLNIRCRGTLKCYKHRSDGALIFASGDEKNQMTDSGDSGGPLLVRDGDSYRVTALVQGEFFFLSEDEKDSEYDALDLGLFVPLPRHREWIKETIAELAALSVPRDTTRYIRRTEISHSSMPLTVNQVITLIRIGTPDEKVFESLRDRGMHDPFDEAARRRLAEAGASERLLEGLGRLSDPVLTLTQLEALVKVDTPENNIMRLLWTHGGVYGQRTAETDRRLREAGASDELIDVMYRKY